MYSDLIGKTNHYRSVRRDVYEKATEPIIDWPERHIENKKRLKANILKTCNNADLKRYRGTDEATARLIWCQSALKIDPLSASKIDPPPR